MTSLSAVGAIILESMLQSATKQGGREKIFLVEQRHDALLFPGEWTFPAEQSSLTGDIAQATARIMHAELGIIFQPIRKPIMPRNCGMHVAYFTGTWWSSRGMIVPRRGIHMGFGWFSFDEARSLSLHQHQIEILDDLMTERTAP